jgi:hypothetical protein
MLVPIRFVGFANSLREGFRLRCIVAPLRITVLSLTLVSAEKAGDFFEGALGGGEADALDGMGSDGGETFKREGEVGAALGGYEGVNLVDDDGGDGAEGGGGFGGEQEVEGFGCGDEDVGGMAAKAGTFGLRSVAGADGDVRSAKGSAGAGGHSGDALQRSAEVALDVDSEGFEGADVDDLAGLACSGLWILCVGQRVKHEAVEAPEECGEGFSGAGGSEDEGAFAASDGWPAE